MTQDQAPPRSDDYDDLWRRTHWNDRHREQPLDRLFVAVLFTSFAWNLVAKEWLPSAAWIPANCAVAAVLVAVARTNGLSWEELGLRRDRLTRGLAVGITAAAAVLLVLAVAVVLPGTEDFFDDAQIAADPVGSRVFNPLVRIPLGTVVLEEMLFRGVLLALALRRWSVITAVLVTSAAFGLWHVVPTPGSDDGLGVILGTLAVTAVAGVLFAWLRLRANSILAPMLAHVATNSFAYLAVVIALQVR